MSINAQVRKVATGYRVKRFKELLPGLDTETLFTDYPKVLMMDLKKVRPKTDISPSPLLACAMCDLL